MLFNSVSYIIFLPVVFFLYWFVSNRCLRQQNILLLLSSYYFYSCWDWRFLFLLIFSTFLDYYIGLKMSEAADKAARKYWFWLSIVVNLGFLGVFKYYNFFAESFAGLLSEAGFQINPWTLNIILPVGISFYTFHGMSYVIDIYHDRIKAEPDFINYAVFVSFFPLLVAGPIERATHLLPQIIKPRTFDYTKAADGMRQILWGLFKKIVIADNCAVIANEIFGNYQHQTGSTLMVGAFFFAFQIYCDFSGYSDIAIGTARLFGIELLRNFAFPYFSRDIAEFWRRWHISLSTWFRDYLYIPLGGSKGTIWFRVRNVFIIFLVSGFWHGANWTFIVWGALNALYFLPLLLSNKNRVHTDTVASGKLFPGIVDGVRMIITFLLTMIAWVFFRSTTVENAWNYLKIMFSVSLFTQPYLTKEALLSLALLLIFIAIEWVQRDKQHGLNMGTTPLPKNLRWAIYIGVATFIAVFGGVQQEFIYFQF